MPQLRKPSEPLPHPSQFRIRFCSTTSSLEQDQESFEFIHKDAPHRLRVHDYAEIYQIPGLYEALVYDKLQCDSPRRVAELLGTVLTDWPREPADLRVLDLGAGNGIMAEELRRIGVRHVVGLDLLPEAAMAAKRDRPDVYEDYIIADLTALSEADRKRLQQPRLNCMVTVAALGFGDIPPKAFATAFNLIVDEGWLAMTIKEDFLDPDGDTSGFARLVRTLVADGLIEIQAHHRFCHRLSIQGEQLFYLAVVARKTADIPQSYLDDERDSDSTTPGTDGSSLLLGNQ